MTNQDKQINENLPLNDINNADLYQQARTIAESKEQLDIKRHNIEINLLREINDKITQPSNVSNCEIKENNSYVDNDKENKNMNDNELKHELEKTNIKIDNTNKIISIIGVALGLLFSGIYFVINVQYSATKDSINALRSDINSKFEVINEKLDAQKEINKLQIQRDVLEETSKQKNNN